MATPATWSIELDVREDALRVFVPAELLPDAAVGDAVDVTSVQPSVIRHGRVIEELDDVQRGRYLTVSFE